MKARDHMIIAARGLTFSAWGLRAKVSIWFFDSKPQEMGWKKGGWGEVEGEGSRYGPPLSKTENRVHFCSLNISNM